MSSSSVYITEDRVRQLLDWEETLAAVERTLVAGSQNRAVQDVEVLHDALIRNCAFLVSGHLQNDTGGTRACEMTIIRTNNDKKLEPPTIKTCTVLFNEETGQMKSIIEDSEMRNWRTAAASVAATKCLHFRHPERKNNILAILGAGVQGRIHAIAFHHFFNFKEIRIWNSKSLVEELVSLGIPARISETQKECVTDADVILIVTVTENPIVHFDWVKSNVHINAVSIGGIYHAKLDEALYHNSVVYVDHMVEDAVKRAGLKKMGVHLAGEIGKLISNDKPLPDNNKITIFHYLHTAHAEDAAVGQIIYDRYMEK